MLRAAITFNQRNPQVYLYLFIFLLKPNLSFCLPSFKDYIVPQLYKDKIEQHDEKQGIYKNIFFFQMYSENFAHIGFLN